MRQVRTFLKRGAMAALLATTAAGAAPTVAAADTALFAGGCFWCVESDMESVNGVTDAVSGYAGGSRQNPTYDDYHEGGFREVVQVEFDPSVISYDQLVHIFLRTIDPTDGSGQFCDRGHGYSPAIYALDGKQEQKATAAVDEAAKALGKSLEVPVEGAAKFWPAEDYHQDYYKSDVRQLTRFGFVTRAKAYKGYREGCGRDKRVRSVWGDQAYQGVSLTH